MSATLDDVRRLFPDVRRGSNGGLMVHCPCHEDTNPSLSFWVDGKGKLAHDCKGGCEWRLVHAELERIGLDFGHSNGNGKLGEMVVAYDYTDEAGEPLYQNCRFVPKDFRARRPDGNGGFVDSIDGVHRVLFHLPRLIAGIKAGRTIYLCEGEKDVLAVEKTGAYATTKAFGASSEWLPEYSESLRGAKVIIVAHKDKDKAGLKCAEKEAAALQGIAASVEIVAAAVDCDGADAADHLAAGLGLDEFVSLEVADPETGEATEAEGDPLVHEAAHAEVLKGAWCGLYRWAEHEACWRHWTGRVWEKAAGSVVVAAAQKVLRGHYGHCLAQPQSRAEDERLHTLHKAACRYASVLAGLAFLKGEPGFHTQYEQWDADPHLLNCAEGLLDMRTQTLGAHDPAALCTKMCSWSYTDQGSTGAWERHLKRCLPSADVRRQVQRDLGRALVGTDLEESLPIWFGSGANGKSTTERALQRGLDGYAKKAVRNLLVAAKYERHPTEIADLAGARLVFSEEVEDGKHLDEALVKELTGGGRKKARFMRCDNFEFEQTFTIMLLVNHRPVITGTDRGIWRRIRLVPWTVAIPLTEQRPQDEVVAELVADGSWILRWMVAGFADWQADHHWVADEVTVATDAYRAEQDRLAEFLADACEEKAFATVSVDELYEIYLSWCGTADEVALGKIAFGKSLKSRGFTQKRTPHGGPRVWLGIRPVTTGDKNPGSSLVRSPRVNEPEKLSPVVTEVVADNVQFIGAREGAGPLETGAELGRAPSLADFGDDDIPF